MRDAISLMRDGEDIFFSFSKAEKVYNQAEFNNHAKYGSLREALRGDLNLLQFVLFRGAKENCDVKKYCLEYADNQKKVDNMEEDEGSAEKEAFSVLKRTSNVESLTKQQRKQNDTYAYANRKFKSTAGQLRKYLDFPIRPKNQMKSKTTSKNP